MKRRWVLAAGLAILAVVLALTLRWSPDPGVPRPLGANVSVGRLTLAIPLGFDSYSMPIAMGPGSPLANRVVTNFRLPAHKTIDRVFDRWSGARSKVNMVRNHNYGPPSDEVALRLDQITGDGCIGPCSPPSARLHLPLGPNQAWDQQRNASGAPSYRDGYLRFDRQLFYVMYWIGPAAPANDRAAVLAALHSIRPRSAT